MCNKKEIVSSLVFFVNGKKVVDKEVDPELTLLSYLRNKLRLCGSKLGCGEGGCGACTVMVSKYDRKNGKVIHFPVNACLAPVCSMHGMAVTTVEGIGSTKTKLHPVQERIAKAHGSQCGFCTPGIVMSMYALLRQMEKPTMKDMEVAFQGNLCRCTGYRPIIEGYKTFTEDWELMQVNGKMNGNGCAMGDQCCKLKNGQNGIKDDDEEQLLYDDSKFLPYDSSQEPIFPPELKLFDALDKQFLQFRNENVIWFRPTTLGQLLELKSQYPEAKIVVGNTEVGVEVKFKQQLYPYIIQPNFIKELNDFKVTNDGISIGASLSLDEIEKSLLKLFKSEAESKTRIFEAIVEMLNWFAGKQIRSVASLGGNIMTGSPISDLNPLLMAAKAVLTFTSSQGTRKVPMDQHFYTGYRKTLARQDEILQSIDIPFTKENQYFFGHKQSRRRDDDIAIVNAGINITINSVDHKIEDINMAFGGLAPTTLLTQKTKNLIGEKLNDDLLEKAYDLLLEELPLPENAPGGMIDYRRTLPISFFYRNYLLIRKELNLKINSKDLSALKKFSSETPKSSQLYGIRKDNTNELDPVGKPLVHMSAFKQVTGEAMYFDDIPHFENELYLAFVYSTKAHAKILSVNTEEALKMNGVIGYINAEDIKSGHNVLGCVVQDEELFVTKTVTSQYQILGAIVAESQYKAQKAARKVRVVYEDLEPIIVSIEDAINHQSFYETGRKIEVGNVDECFANAKHVIEGQCRTGYQEHFYLETHGCLVVPRDADEYEIFSSSQHPAEITDFVARVLNISQNKINTRIKRIGGGFGGKQSRSTPIVMAVALAAKKFQRPVRIMLDRDEDMAMTGGRHPYMIQYKAAFESSGKLTALDYLVYANGGFSNDLSLEVLDRVVFHVENCYKVDNLRVIGKICKTNLPTNTAFRGFGAPQAMFAAENMIRDVAEYLNVPVVEIQRQNLYQEGQKTHYNQQIINCNLGRCFEECLEKSNYTERKTQITAFNKENRWKKRGISLVATKYGVGFGVPFLEQNGSVVNIYTDGSVLVTHGGIEMGQGLNTKMIQVASRVLEISPNKIHTTECATDKVPNSSPTAASVGSDLNGMAVLRACEQLKKRLEPIKKKMPDASWEQLVKAAYFERINLSAVGHFATPDVIYNWESNSGSPYNYYTFGAACTEVEIDCLTGDHRILRTDIVMDLGSSLNPAIDIGQVEGAFMQGYGLFVLEEMVYSPTGTVYTKGPGAYKIPSFGDIPLELNVRLLKGSENPRAVFSSKAVGEPPLFLASSALFAIREAIKDARFSAGITEKFVLNAPATAEKIRMACADHFTKKVTKNGATKSTWNVVP